MSVTLTSAAIKEYVRVQLGVPVIVVELIDEMFDVFINKALRVYNSHRPLFKMFSLDLVSGQQAYVLTTYGLGVVQCWPQETLRLNVDLSDFDLMLRYHGFKVMRSDPGDYYARMLWREEVKRAVGSDFDWHYDLASHTLYLNISSSVIDIEKVTYIYAINATLTEVPASNDKYIEDYVLALSKLALGRIRNKFGGIPGAEGNISLDGADLISEGKEEKEKLEADMANVGDIVPPMIG